jgi:glycerophosphoryl diester phosphodiesterase
MARRTRRRSRRRVLAILIAGALGWLFGYEPTYSGTLVTPGNRPIVLGHRGLGDAAPDNSLFATEEALRLGIDGVDVDGQFTRDSVLVIYHDLSVDRLTSDTGRVASKTSAQMLALDLGPKAKVPMTGALVRTFEDFVIATKGRGLLSVELKVPSAKASGIEEAAVRVLAKHDAFDRVVLSSFNPLVLWRLKQVDPRVRTVLIFMDTNWNPELVREIRKGDEVDLPWPLRQEWCRRAIRKMVRPDYLSVNHEVAESTIDRLLEKGWPIFLWTPNDDAGIVRVLNKRPFGMMSDQAVRARQLRDSLFVQ